MALDYDKFDKMVDLDDLRDASSGSGDFEEVPDGTYEVDVEKFELVESSKGSPMVKGWFRILSGEYKGQLIFMNQVVTLKFQVGIVNDIIRGFDVIPEENVKFETFKQYDNLICDTLEAIRAQRLQYALKQTTDKKGYKRFSIVEVYEPEN